MTTKIIEANAITQDTCNHTIGYYHAGIHGISHIDQSEVAQFVIDKRADAIAKIRAPEFVDPDGWCIKYYTTLLNLSDEQIADEKIIKFAHCPKCGTKLPGYGEKS